MDSVHGEQIQGKKGEEKRKKAGKGPETRRREDSNGAWGSRSGGDLIIAPAPDSFCLFRLVSYI